MVGGFRKQTGQRRKVFAAVRRNKARNVAGGVVMRAGTGVPAVGKQDPAVAQKGKISFAVAGVVFAARQFQNGLLRKDDRLLHKYPPYKKEKR